MTDEKMQRGFELQRLITRLREQKTALNGYEESVGEKGIQLRNGYSNSTVYVSPSLSAVIITLVAAEINEKLRQAENEFADL